MTTISMRLRCGERCPKGFLSEIRCAECYLADLEGVKTRNALTSAGGCVFFSLVIGIIIILLTLM